MSRVLINEYKNPWLLLLLRIYNDFTVFTENTDHLLKVLKMQTYIIFTIALRVAHHSEIEVKVVTFKISHLPTTTKFRIRGTIAQGNY